MQSYFILSNVIRVLYDDFVETFMLEINASTERGEETDDQTLAHNL